MFDWTELLLNIEDRNVIPVIGKELVIGPDGKSLEQKFIESLIPALNLASEDLSDEPD